MVGVDIHGHIVIDVSLANDASKTTLKILECSFWGDGVVGVGSDMQLYVAEVGLTVSSLTFINDRILII